MSASCSHQELTQLGRLWYLQDWHNTYTPALCQALLTRNAISFYLAQVKRREARQGVHASEWTESTADFLRQMGYREYARYLSFHFPFTHERSLLEHVRAAPWRYNQSLFKVRQPPASSRLRLGCPEQPFSQTLGKHRTMEGL